MKKQAKIIETKVFESYEEAKDLLDTAEHKFEKTKKGLLIAAVATLFGIIGLIVSENAFDSVWSGIGVWMAIISYVIGGGFKNALKMAWKVGVFGWFVVPFPVDIFTGMITFLLAVMAFLIAPVIVVGLNYHQLKMDCEEAKRYLGYFKDMAPIPVQVVGTENIDQ